MIAWIWKAGRPPEGARGRHARAPAGPARARGTDRRRAVGDHPAGAAARVHPPGQAQGSRPGARPPRRRVAPITASTTTALDSAQRALWQALRSGSDDPLLRQDAERVPAVLATRAADQNWADSRGRRHGAPLFAGPHLGSAGAHRAAAARVRATCSTSPRATACSPNCWRRMRIATSASTPARAWWPPRASACAASPNVEVREGDMHALPFADGSFDLVRADARPDLCRQARAGGGRSRARAAHAAAACCCRAWPGTNTAAVVEAYGHANLGFTRKGTAQVRRKGRAEHRQLRHRDAREAPAAFRSDCRCSGVKP